VKAFSSVRLLTAVLLILPALTQDTQKDFSDPIALLNAVARNYARGVDTFRMESISEISSNSDLRHEWRKVYRTAIKGPGSLYRIETRSPYGSFIQDSDGTNEWVYQIEGRMYVKRPLPLNWPQFPKLQFAGSLEVSEAWSMRVLLEFTVAGYKRADMLPQETITVEGHTYPCYVVHVTSDDTVRGGNSDFRSDTTLWIDKTALVIRKQTIHSHAYALDGGNRSIRIPFIEHSTIIYPAADFDVVIDPALFKFVPPAEAKEVARLEGDWYVEPAAPTTTRIGQLAPDVSFLAADGRKVELASYRGKPLLLDFWATWCAPCLASMPTLNRIYMDVRNKGIGVVTLDEDNPEMASEYLARHNYSWVNYHDDNWEISHAFKNRAIPLTVLINGRGEIQYYAEGVDEAAVRKAIASLGPEFAPLDPPASAKARAARH
jgi:thiol-disulfide isomerase/thioredoxin/outer membrane lipoprotein-sorting protein